MKKLFLPIIAAVLTLCGVAVYAFTNHADSRIMAGGTEIPQLLMRAGDLAKAAEWQKTQDKVAELTQKIVAEPTDVKPRLQLATIYMSEGRITGDAYYNQASLILLNGILGLDANNFEATTYKASVAMSLHQFAEAKTMATKAMQINPSNAYVYGVLVDANVELGNYTEAIALSDKMQTLKPSLESYSRASYLREINGDYTGAIAAMDLAVKAGLPGTESAEWARVTLGDLYLATGDLAKAEAAYTSTLSVRPNFPNAEIGLAKVAKAKKDYVAAIAHTKTAIRIVSEASYIAFLGELQEAAGDLAEATKIKTEVIRGLERAEKAQNSSEIVMKHNANRELAQAYLAQKNYAKALTYAKNDLALRPENIDANELVAWVTYLKGDAAAAQPYADKMLRTNTKNAEKLHKAALIYTKIDAAKSTELMTAAKAINAYIN